jgi:Cu-processing system permease protein
MPTRIDAVRTIAAHELRGALRGKMVPAFAALFAALAVGISLAGLGASGQVIVQGFTRTAVSLMTLSLYLLPLLGLVMGAAAFGGDDGAAELLLAQPIGRGEALLGRAAGLFAALGMVSLAGFGTAGALVAAQAGTEGIGGYVGVALGSTFVGFAGLALGVLIGVSTRRRASAVGWALAAWFGAAVLYDLACIGVLQVAGSGEPGPYLVALLALNPMDGIRALGLVQLGADVLLGPTGAALQKLLGATAGTLVVLGGLVAWTAGPLALASRAYRRRDF